MTDPLRERLAASLHRRAGSAPAGGDLAGEAIRLGRRMRTRRRIGAACAAAVLVGAAVPLGASLTADLREPQVLGAPAHTAPASAAPTPTGATGATGSAGSSGPAASTVPVNLDDLPRGPDPDVPWYADGLIHDGHRQVRLGADVHPAGLTSVSGGYLVLDEQAGTGAQRLLLVDPAGGVDVLSSGPVTPPVVVAAAYREIAWARQVAGRTELVLADADTGKVLDRAAYDGDLQPVGFVRGMVLLTRQGAKGPGAWLWIVGRGIAPVHGTVGATATDPERGLAAVTTGYRADPKTGADRTCSAVVRAADDESRVWSSCRYRPVRFSADGRRVYAVGSATEGLGASRVFVLDAATGRPLLRLRVQGVTQRAAWEGGDAVVFDAWTGGRMALVRCGVDGGCELATDPVPQADPAADPPPYLLGQRARAR